MITQSRNAIEDKLQELAEKIAIPNSMYEEAKNNYEAVGEWLAKETSILYKYSPQIYPQGSFALGTAINNMVKGEKRVAIIGKNRYEWALAHISNLLGGIVSVPLDKDLQYDELERSLIRSKADAVVFDAQLTEDITKIMDRILSSFPANIIYFTFFI